METYYVFPPDSPRLALRMVAQSIEPVARVDNISPQCRICFSDADREEGGDLLEPCRCRGTSKYVHTRCLRAWIAHSQSVKRHRAFQCDICRATYDLPPTFHHAEGLPATLTRHFHHAWGHVLDSPVGPAVASYTALSHHSAILWAIFSAAIRFVEMPRMLMAARHEPAALRPLLPGFLLSLLVEPWRHSDMAFHLGNAFLYAAGWGLDAAARFAHCNWVARLPPEMQQLACFLLAGCKGVGLAVQAVQLTFLCLFSGLAGGFGAGVMHCIEAPLMMASAVADTGAFGLSLVRDALHSGGRAAAAVGWALGGYAGSVGRFRGR